MTKFVMKVDLNLRSVSPLLIGNSYVEIVLYSSVSMNVVQPSEADILFVSTPQHGSSRDNDLLRIAYTRVQRESPDFLSVYDSTDQNVEIKMSTLVFRIAPEPVLALYDLIMSTFGSNSENTRAETGSMVGKNSQTQFQAAEPTGVIRVSVKLDGIRGL